MKNKAILKTISIFIATMAYKLSCTASTLLASTKKFPTKNIITVTPLVVELSSANPPMLH